MCCGRQRAVLPINQVQAAENSHLPDAQFLQIAARDFSFHAHPGNNGYSLFHFHKPLDALDGRQLDIHAEGYMVAREHLHHSLAVGGIHNMRDEGLLAERGDFHVSALG